MVLVMNEIAVLEDKRIENMIYEIRGKQVMLDSDLAKLYQCANGTKSINLAVKRNLNRFPNDFYFQLTEEEALICSKFQFETLNTKGTLRGTNIKKLPFVFTEQGVAMLSSVLKTTVASEISIHIMRAFVTMRKYISSNLLEQKYINNQVMKNTEDIKLLQETFSKLEEKKKTNAIFFEGQIYDAYSLMKNIFCTAKEEIIIIDNYLDKSLLDIVSKHNNKVLIITNQYNNDDYNKYKSQYSNITLKVNNTFHDRFIIVDKKILYHCGASFKDLGKKCFAITLIEDNEILRSILKKI